MTPDIYQEDLAQIHIEGYGFHWEKAATTVLETLRRHRITTGKIIDLGCGGGQWLQKLAHEGYSVCGVDASTSMIQAAKKRVPSGSCLHASFADIELPICDAVTSLGEPINYLNGKRAIKRTFRRVFSALRPGGLFIFDALQPATRPVIPRTATRVGDTWACIAQIVEDSAKNLLVRHITSFRQIGDHYRRSEEIHRLKIYAKRDMIEWLRATGFRVRTYRGYGDYRFQQRQVAFVARKP